MKFTYLDPNNFHTAEVMQHPYPYAVINQCIVSEKLTEVCRDFPVLPQGGSFPLSQVQCQGEFAGLIRELASAEFRTIIAKKFALDLSHKPPVITLRGYSRENRDGRVHTDSKTKIITILIYFNQTWDVPGGRLRILNSNNLEDYKVEIAPLAGTCLIFKVTDNCWHGHPPFEGVRHSIQLNYVANDAAADQHLLRHRVSAQFKKIRKLFSSN